MKSFLVKIFKLILLLANIAFGILYIGTIFELTVKWFGILGFLLFLIITPLFSPTILFFPWFEAWANQDIVNENSLWIWGTWITLQTLVLIFSAIEVYKEQNLLKRYNKLLDE